MVKLYYYILQTDRTLPEYLQDAEERATHFLTNDTMLAMDHPSTDGLIGALDDAGEDDDDEGKLLDGDNVLDGNEEEVNSDDDG
jgi:hypothetical protein